MNAKKFLHKKDVAYMNRLSTSLDFDRIASLMEEYAALCIHDVVGRSEQLKAFLDEIANDKTYIKNDYYKNKAKRLSKSL